MTMPPGFEYNIDNLYEEAKRRWLKPIEVLYILRNHENCKFTNFPPHQPESGSLFLFNRRIMRFFRKDGHNWRKKKDGRSVAEGHERLKVGNVEILNCYYAHGEENRAFQRRSYWMLDPAYEHIVLVHYRDTSEGTSGSGPVTQSNYYENLFDQIQMQDQFGADSSLTISQKQEFTIRSVSPEWCYSTETTKGTSSSGLVTQSDYYANLFEQIQMQDQFGADSSLTVSQKQKFTIRAVSPEWCYSTETTKIIIIGTFLCPPSDSSWACMFGDIEVPAEVIQEGVICCEAPAHLPGNVNLCITSGNRESCSEVREFEFRDKIHDCTHCNSLETETARNPEELLLLVRFAQMLLSVSTIKSGNIESVCLLPTIQKADDDSWSHIIGGLLVGSGTSSGFVDWVLEELLKDKLQQWLSHKSQESNEGTGCFLSKKDQGIIHMVAGLGFEWALNPILSCGVNVNFRDINGWTALHWAARFGREKMAASLIACGASAGGGAVTDPSSKDPVGKTAASIAASSGHKGLAGYLSEVDLINHLSSLTVEESEISKGSAELLAEYNIGRVCTENIGAGDDQVPLEDTLAAVKNAALAAARIQAAFRAHSFRKRREREAAATAAHLDGCEINPDNIDNLLELSALSKHSFGSRRDYNSAALSIQKKYRGWKGRKDFLALRQKVVKIQAHVRGYQVRKQYKFIVWAVGIWEKVVLRWRRKEAGLHRPEPESIDESDDEDFLKVFRKQKVHVAVEKAFSRVLSMVHSSGARQQYRRMLEMYREAKAELGSTLDEAPSSTSGGDVYNTENDGFFEIPWEWEMI